jgi:transposase InsO family protein
MEERRQIVREYKSRGLSVCKAVQVAGMSRSSFYYRSRTGKPGRAPSRETSLLNGQIASNEEVVEIIKDLLGIDFVDYGYIKVTHWLNQHGFYISKKKVYRLMKEHGLLLKSLKPSPARNFVKFTRAMPTGPFELLEMDIKYIYIHGTGSNALLLTILDTFTRKALVRRCQLSMRKSDVKSLIDQLIVDYLQPYNLLNGDIKVTVRSDNGSQFIASLVRGCLRDNFILQEFTHPATPQQNGHIESFHAVVRRLVEEKYEFENLRHLKDVLEAFYLFYNRYRIHSSICYLSPDIFFEAWQQGLVKLNEHEKHPGRRFQLLQPPFMVVKNFYLHNFEISGEVEVGSAGEQPARNNLTDWNSPGGLNDPPSYLTIPCPYALENSTINRVLSKQ